MRALVMLVFDQGQQAAIMSNISKEQARIGELEAEGVVQAIYIQADLARVWLALEGESEATLRSILETLPLYPYVKQVDFSVLAGPMPPQ